MSEFLTSLLEANIAAGAAVAIVLFARGWVRRRWGAHAAYLMWAMVPIATLATLVPARTVVIEAPAALLASDDFQDAVLPATQDTGWIGAALSALPLLWIAGFAAMAMWLLLGQARFLGDVRRGKAGPAVVGLLRPHIVIPSDFGGRFEAREQELILAHERFHLARQDARLNTLVALVRCLCWFNPMIHVGAHVMRIDQELSCDAAVVGRRPGARRAYAETLLKTQLAARPLPLGCYWPAGTQHPLTERIAMLTRTSPSRRTRLLASAAVVMIAAGGGVAAWAMQPERAVVQEGPAPTLQKPPRQTTEAEQAEAAARAQYWLDRRIELLRAEPEQRPPPAPEAPRPAPAPRDGFVPIPAPETPRAAPAPARDFFVPIAPEAPAPLALTAPLAAPAPEPLEAPQELTQAERDALLKEMEAQRQEMERQRVEMEAQRKQFEIQRQEFEAERKQFDTLRQRLQLEAPLRLAPGRIGPGELKLDRPLDGAVLKKLPPDIQQKLELAYRFDRPIDGPEVKKLPPEVLKKLDGAVIRNKIITQGAGARGPLKLVSRNVEQQLADLRKAESLATDQTAKTKLNETIRMLEDLQKRGPSRTQDAPQ